jgi:hypothetical protein
MAPHLAFTAAGIASTCAFLSGRLPLSRTCLRKTDPCTPSFGHRSRIRSPLRAAAEHKQHNDDEDEQAFLARELARLESLEELVEELEKDDLYDDDHGSDSDQDDDDTWMELFGMLPEEADPEELAEMEKFFTQNMYDSVDEDSAAGLENALMQGVVPANAGVGSGALPGDFGFDPLNLSTRDYIGRIQRSVLGMLPERDPDDVMFQTLSKTPFVPDESSERPSALILRDYREAEIRHGRLAMLAAFFWPLQEMLDRLLLDEDQFGSLLFRNVTLPYIPLFLTAIMLLLGYLDIYSKAIQDVEELGDAYLPGDCFWDPLAVLQGAPDTMKRNMQERELFNGRVAMIAFAVYVFEEATTGLPIISIPSNDLLFEPAYQIPFIQKYLDSCFKVRRRHLLFQMSEVSTLSRL